jgi:hypothetical protein
MMFKRPPAVLRRRTQAEIRAAEQGPTQLKHQPKHLHGIAPRLGIYSGDDPCQAEDIRRKGSYLTHDRSVRVLSRG